MCYMPYISYLPHMSSFIHISNFANMFALRLSSIDVLKTNLPKIAITHQIRNSRLRPLRKSYLKSIMDLISILEIGKFSITAITAITELIPKVGYLLPYSCSKNEFPGKRYNASNHSFVFLLHDVRKNKRVYATWVNVWYQCGLNKLTSFKYFYALYNPFFQKKK
jgi:hypothetical protein